MYDDIFPCINKPNLFYTITWKQIWCGLWRKFLKQTIVTHVNRRFWFSWSKNNEVLRTCFKGMNKDTNVEFYIIYHCFKNKKLFWKNWNSIQTFYVERSDVSDVNWWKITQNQKSENLKTTLNLLENEPKSFEKLKKNQYFFCYIKWKREREWLVTVKLNSDFLHVTKVYSVGYLNQKPPLNLIVIY